MNDSSSIGKAARSPVLVLYAHPDTENKGNCFAILGEVRKELEARSLPYDLIDLYQDRFDPVMRPEEHYVSGGKVIAPEVALYQERFRRAEEIIIIHPVWWGTMPAILKGFFDRLLTPGFGYQYVHGRPQKLFNGKRALVFSTSGGPWWWTRIVQGARSRRNLRKDILGFLGIEARVYVLPDAGRVTDERKELIARFVASGMRRWLGAPPRPAES